MVKKKTSIEKLETRNETVTDMRSALIAVRWKWREIQGAAIDLSILIDHECGFCVMAETKGAPKCDHCPDNISDFCDEIQPRTLNILNELDCEICTVLEFLNGLKFDD